MNLQTTWCFLVILYFSLSDAFSVDNLQKCNMKDYDCQKIWYQNLIKEVGKSGIPDLNIPPLDPIVLKNVAVTVLDMANITLIDGVAKGIKDCIINKFELDFEKGVVREDLMCDFMLKGHYTMSGESDLLTRLAGSGGLRGNGKGKVKLEKLVVNMKFPLYPEKHEDGEIYLKCLYKQVEYNYDIKAKASFALDNIFIGKENITELVMQYMNENWRYVVKTFGKAFVDKALEFHFDFAQKFFEGVPAKYFIIGDLTSYLKD